MSDNKYVPLHDWDTPRHGFFHVVTGCWWPVNKEGLPLLYQSRTGDLFPEYHRQRDMAEELANGRPVRWFSVVYVPINPMDYDYYMGAKND